METQAKTDATSVIPKLKFLLCGDTSRLDFGTLNSGLLIDKFYTSTKMWILSNFQLCVGQTQAKSSLNVFIKKFKKQSRYFYHKKKPARNKSRFLASLYF